MDGPPLNGSYSRPWWILNSDLEHDMRAGNRWNDVVSLPSTLSSCGGIHSADGIIQVRWWSAELSKNQYDGIIGLSQGAAMTALLVSMVSLRPVDWSVFGTPS